MHSPATLQDTGLLPDKAARRALQPLTRPQTIAPPDALPNDKAASSLGDATANHHHNLHAHVHAHTHAQGQQPQPSYQQPSQHFTTSNHVPRIIDHHPPKTTSIAASSVPSQVPPSTQQRPLPSSDSQTSSLSAEPANVFTPPASQGDMPGGGSLNGHDSSQESQLLQLSHIAAAQDKLAEDNVMATARKRMADGALKENTSPVRMGHSRNTSTVSMASTTASSIGDWSSDLKTRLSYAMLKVNHGWQSHSIDEVESMASQAASPTSSHSTLHGRQELSASPRANMARYQPRVTAYPFSTD
ncbi:hypothetical protein COL5a_010609 [Colletotrichum fioriniae]|nr:hypothetical protein COL5a_010609 [Colletotrichum fioriniae]